MSGADLKPWDRFCEFVSEATRVFRSFSMSLDAKKLAFAFTGVAVWLVGVLIINALMPVQWVILVAAGAVATAFLFVAFARSESDFGSRRFVVSLVSSVLGVWLVVVLLIILTRQYPLEREFLVNIYKVAWTLAVAAFFGTAVCRIAAVDAAAEDTVGPRETSRFALRKLSTSVWTLLAPVLAVIAFGLVLLIVGLPGRIPGFGGVWYVILGIFYIIALLGGLFFALTLLVYLPGLVLFQPAIAAEDNDAFDAISRAYSYVFGRPWRLLFYGVISFFYARVVLAVAAVLFAWAGRITNIFLSKGIGSSMTKDLPDLDLGAVFGVPYAADPLGNVAGAAAYVRNVVLGGPFSGPVFKGARQILGGNVLESFKASGSVGGWFVVFWQYVLLVIFMAFAVTLIYSLFTHIYLLMRKAVDGTPLEEVYLEPPEEEEYEAEFAGEGEKAEEPAEKPPAEEEKPGEEEKKKDVTDEPVDLAGEEEEKDSGEEESEEENEEEK